MEHTELLGSLDIGDYIPWLGWWSRVTGLDAKLDKVAARFDEFLNRVVQEHMDDTGHKEDDEMDVLLEIQQENSKLNPRTQSSASSKRNQFQVIPFITYTTVNSQEPFWLELLWFVIVRLGIFPDLPGIHYDLCIGSNVVTVYFHILH
ncbi:hypothetical protein ABKV19_012039 [Rosa sericea]